MEGKYLITTDAWFIAPDGRSYQAVWGDVKILEDTVLGLRTNRNATNWYAKIGSEDNHVIVAGCQIHYAVKSEKKPFVSHGTDWSFEEGGAKIGKTPTRIYIAE